MAGDAHRDLLDRATAAIERIDRTLERQEKAFERQEASHDRLMQRLEEDRVEGRARHEQMMRRFERSEQVFIEAISDIDASLKRNTERLDEMGQWIRANTQAVLSVLDRLGPATG